jgi:hypothetical protein
MDFGRACSPFDSHPAAYVFPAEGDEVLISKNIHTNLERTVIGLTVLVRSLATARVILNANHIGYVEAEQCDTHSIWVKPSDAHGVWLEFAQGIGSNQSCSTCSRLLLLQRLLESLLGIGNIFLVASRIEKDECPLLRVPLQFGEHVEVLAMGS